MNIIKYTKSVTSTIIYLLCKTTQDLLWVWTKLI